MLSDKPSGLGRSAGGLDRSAAPYSCSTGYSREGHVLPTDTKQSSQPDGAARPFFRSDGARWRKGPEPSQYGDPLADGPRPAFPGAPFIGRIVVGRCSGAGRCFKKMAK